MQIKTGPFFNNRRFQLSTATRELSLSRPTACARSTRKAWHESTLPFVIVTSSLRRIAIRTTLVTSYGPNATRNDRIVCLLGIIDFDFYNMEYRHDDRRDNIATFLIAR